MLQFVFAGTAWNWRHSHLEVYFWRRIIGTTIKSKASCISLDTVNATWWCGLLPICKSFTWLRTSCGLKISPNWLTTSADWLQAGIEGSCGGGKPNRDVTPRGRTNGRAIPPPRLVLLYLHVFLFRSTFLSRLIKWVLNVRPSVRPQMFIWFQWNLVCWYVGRGRRVMHEGMQYDPIQGQEPLKVGNSTIFIGYHSPPFIMRAGKWPGIPKLGGQYLKLIGAGFLVFVLVFVSRDFEVGSGISRILPPVPYGANLSLIGGPTTIYDRSCLHFWLITKIYASAAIQFDPITQVWVKRIFLQNLQTHHLKSEKYRDLREEWQHLSKLMLRLVAVLCSV